LEGGDNRLFRNQRKKKPLKLEERGIKGRGKSKCGEGGGKKMTAFAKLYQLRGENVRATTLGKGKGKCRRERSTVMSGGGRDVPKRRGGRTACVGKGELEISRNEGQKKLYCKGERIFSERETSNQRTGGRGKKKIPNKEEGT